LSAERRVVGDARAIREASFPCFETDAPPPKPAPGRQAAAPRADDESARRLAADAEALRARVRAEAFEVGVRQGHEAAYAEWSGKLGALATSLESVARALTASRVELAAEVERQLPRLLELLVRRVLHHELGASDTAARTVIRSLAERLAGCDRPVVVRVAPDMVEALEAWRHSTGESPDTPSVRIEADASLSAGDWVVDTGDGFLDGRVESQLEAAWQLLKELQT